MGMQDPSDQPSEYAAGRRPRVVFFAPGLSEIGGAAKRSRLIAHGLAGRGWDVRVVARAGTLRQFRFERSPGLTIVEVPGRSWPGALLYALVASLAALCWRPRTRAYLALQLFSTALIAAAWGRLLRIPTVLMTSTSGQLGEVELLSKRRFAKARLALLAGAHRFVAQTEYAAASLATVFPPERIVVIPNPAAEVDATGLTGEPRVLYAGRFSEEKDLVTLLGAWAPLVEELPTGRLFMVGSGGAYRSVEAQLRAELAGNSLLRASVELHPWCKGLGEWLRTCDVYVFPSLSEGMSNALIEAVMWRRVVVASDIPANLAVVGADYPLTYPAGDMAALQETLRRALTDAHVRQLATSVLARQGARFHPDRVIPAIEALLSREQEPTQQRPASRP